MALEIQASRDRVPPLPPAPPAGRWVRLEKPASRRAWLNAHLPWVLLLTPVFVFARLIPVSGAFPFTMCAFRTLTGRPCLFCGYTRAFAALARSEWRLAATQCPAALPLFAGLAGLLAWHALGLLSGRIVRLGPALRPGRAAWTLLLGGGGLLILANWIYRLAAGLQ